MQRPVPWQPFAAVVALFLAALGANQVWKPHLELSTPTLIHQMTGGYEARFEAVNHTRHAVTAVVEMICGPDLHHRSPYRMRGSEMPGGTVTISLAPGEKQKVACDLALPGGSEPPIYARAVVASFREQMP